ncbi:cytochrome P450 71D11-like [Humulus lupulus]|uniref:cytochrome P450 71D11-like n=1 Tax=Humulus lupulus TaxID=3486 RepID=UPI002B40C264|nr:cytochrome P450 71D11-like [Humulus lupulus]
MEMEIPSFPVLFFSIVVFMVMKMLLKNSQNSSSASKLPPGPWKLPIVGNIHQLIGPLIHQTLGDLAMKHGPLMYLRVGEVPTIVISSPEYAKEVMRVHDITFASRPSNLFARIIFHDCTDLAFAPYGEYWRQLRKIFMQELLSAARVQSFKPIREEEMFNFIESISSNLGDVINLNERLNMLMYNIISRAACGRTRSHNEEFLSVLMETTEVSIGFELADLFPSVKLFSQMSRSRPKLERLTQRAARIFEDIIHEHKQKMPIDRNGDGETDEDLVDVLLKFHDKDDLGFSLTSQNIYAIIFDIFGAGIETTATSVEWAMSEMMKNPRTMKKAQDEVREVFNKRGLVDETGLAEMNYLKSVVKESMRLHPIFPLLLPRESQEKCEINGYEIPAKTQTIVNSWVIGRDPRYWSEPESFKPERFLDSSIDSKGNNFDYLPFGGGRRICAGMSFGLHNVELSLALLLYHYDWILPNGMKHEDLDMTESFGATLKRKNALNLFPIACDHLSPTGKSQEKMN